MNGRKMKKSGCRIVKKYRRAALVLVLLTVCFLFSHNRLDEVEAENNEVYYTYYHCTRVEYGDSLWGYAQQVERPENISVNDYINAVRRINGLTSDDIRIGDYLTLPYYSTECF